MASRLREIFDNSVMVDKIQQRLPYMFQIAELECMRGGKIGMEVGNLRERIIVALIVSLFGRENIETEIPTTQPEVDLKLFGEPISIKTISGMVNGVKLVWTVDPQKVAEFVDTYSPTCDLLFIQIRWGELGRFCYIPVEVQEAVLNRLGKRRYIVPPKQGTNPRGVEISREALEASINDSRSKTIPIHWIKVETTYNPYDRWIEYWEE